MNQYGTIAKKHWQKWLPARYSQLPDPEVFFEDLGEQIAEQVEELSLAMAGDDPPGEGYLDKMGRLNTARLNAESAVLKEMALLEPEDEAVSS